jgi:hypothetical protein
LRASLGLVVVKRRSVVVNRPALLSQRRQNTLLSLTWELQEQRKSVDSYIHAYQ